MTAPFSDLLIIDLTHVLAGPYCSMILSDLGARVIKVERPDTGDDTRHFPPFRDNGDSAYFATINRGKESIALNLKCDADRVVFEDLLSRADILMENYRPGVMERLGYGFEDLHNRFPRLIYGAVSGFGHTGPEALKPAYDMVVQARGGVMSITGEKDREPVRVGASVGDIVAGMFLGHGIMAALYQREKTGLGQKVDVAMLDSQLAILEHAIAITGESRTSPGPSGARHPSIAPFETFHAEDGLFVIAAGNDDLFAKLCAALEIPALSQDDRFITNAARCLNVKLLKRLIEAVTLGEDREHWQKKLSAAGIPCAPIQNVAEAMRDPQILARDMVIDVADPNGGPAYKAAGNPIKLSAFAPEQDNLSSPLLNEHSKSIRAWLKE